MDKVTRFFRAILRDRIQDTEGQRVRVIPKYLPEGKTPSITIFNMGGYQIEGSEKLLNIKAPLNEKHPLYDSSQPDKLYPQQFRRSRNGTTIQVNVWATTEQDRYHINEQIKELIWMLKSDHYLLCPFYNKDTHLCSNLETNCPVTTINNYHTAKGQCPKPKEYNYRSLFTEYDIIRGTFRDSPEFNQDEPNQNQPLLRTIHEFDLEYYMYYNLEGNISIRNTFEEEVERTP